MTYLLDALLGRVKRKEDPYKEERQRRLKDAEETGKKIAENVSNEFRRQLKFAMTRKLDLPNNLVAEIGDEIAIIKRQPL